MFGEGHKVITKPALEATTESKAWFGSSYFSPVVVQDAVMFSMGPSFPRQWDQAYSNATTQAGGDAVAYNSGHISGCWGGTQPLNRSASEGEQPDQTLLSPEIAVLEINAIHTLPVLWMVSFTQNIALHLVLHLAVIEEFLIVFLSAKLL